MIDQSLAAGTPCWLSNAYPRLKVGTAVLLLESVTRATHNERALVRTEDGVEHVVTSLSLAEMLPEEIPAWMQEHPQ